MFTFRVETHQMTGKPKVEVHKDGEYIADIYGLEDGLRIVSKHLDGVEHEPGSPPTIVIRFTK